MKSVCAILIMIIAAHLQCGASCLADSVKTTEPVSAAPPCHQHAGVPVHSQPAHERSSPCGQGAVLEVKATANIRYAPPDAADGLPVIQTIIISNDISFSSFTPEKPRHESSPPLSLSVLRI
jgi:hypothetical protein